MSRFRQLITLQAQTPPTPTVREFRWSLTTSSNNYTYTFTQKNSISDYYIDWGDGSDVETGTRSHKYVTAGDYQIRIYDTPTTTTFPLVSMARSTDTYLETSIDTVFPYIDNTTDFSSLFKYSAGIISVPAGLFDNNPQITTLKECFCYCRKLQALPDYLLRNLPNCYDFNQFIRGTRALKLNANLFCDETTEKTTRFASYTNQVDFRQFLYRVTPMDSTSNNGVAPELWNYTYGAGVNSGSCFQGGGNSATTLTNYSSIPSGWK